MALLLPKNLDLQTCLHLPKSIQILSQNSQNKSKDVSITKNDIKAYLPVNFGHFYPNEFVKLYLLIKLNSLSKKEAAFQVFFLNELAKIYNTQRIQNVQISLNQGEMFSQILSCFKGEISLSVDQFNNAIEGNALLAASAVWLIKKSRCYLKKQEVAFSLSFVSLGGRQIAFTPIVHIEKNHDGQVFFASRIKSMVKLQKKFQRAQGKVQDPYSMRCSPQVHGIGYDCVSDLEEKVHFLINKPHVKYLVINGKKIRNMLMESDTFSLKLDFAICCLQEMGAMSFLRAERLLNSYLGKNNLLKKPQYQSLFSMMKSTVSKISKNKVLSEMTNFDTCNIDSYSRDIFYNSGSFFSKIEQLFDNLYYVMTLEAITSFEALKDILKGNLEQVRFTDKFMQDNFNYLKQKITVSDKQESYKVIKDEWMNE